MAKMTLRERTVFDALGPLAVSLAGRRITSEDLLGLDTEYVAVIISEALGRRAELVAKFGDGNPPPPDDLAFAVELDVFKLLRPWWEKR